MTRMTHYPNGTPSWIDLGTPDPAGAATFYRGLFGWDVQAGPPEAGGYAMALLEGAPVAGIGPQQSPGMPPWWTTYVAVTDVDATAARAVARGGTMLVDPMDVLDVGRMAVLSDPAGATFSIWQARSHIGASIVNEPGTLCWNELMTREIDTSIIYYESVFGWHPERRGEGNATTYVEFHLDGRPIGGLMPIGDGFPPDIPNHWMVYFAVTDTAAAAAKVGELGGKVMMPPFDTPVGPVAVVSDPQGAVFSIITLTNPPA